MSLRLDAKLLGAGDVEKLLSKLPDKIGAKVLKQSMRAATKPMVKQAKSLAPKRTGKLQKSIKVKDSRKKIKGNHAVLFGVTKEAPHAHLIEYGTQPHAIKVKDKRFLKIGGLEIFGLKEVHHPGTRARPFLRPAFDMGKGKWFPDLGKEVGKLIDKEVKKLRKL